MGLPAVAVRKQPFWTFLSWGRQPSCHSCNSQAGAPGVRAPARGPESTCQGPSGLARLRQGEQEARAFPVHFLSQRTELPGGETNTLVRRSAPRGVSSSAWDCQAHRGPQKGCLILPNTPPEPSPLLCDRHGERTQGGCGASSLRARRSGLLGSSESSHQFLHFAKQCPRQRRVSSEGALYGEGISGV